MCGAVSPPARSLVPPPRGVGSARSSADFSEARRRRRPLVLFAPTHQLTSLATSGCTTSAGAPSSSSSSTVSKKGSVNKAELLPLPQRRGLFVCVFCLRGGSQGWARPFPRPSSSSAAPPGPARPWHPSSLSRCSLFAQGSFPPGVKGSPGSVRPPG